MVPDLVGAAGGGWYFQRPGDRSSETYGSERAALAALATGGIVWIREQRESCPGCIGGYSRETAGNFFGRAKCRNPRCDGGWLRDVDADRTPDRTSARQARVERLYPEKDDGWGE